MRITKKIQILICAIALPATCLAQDSIVLDKIVAVVGRSIIKLSDIENQHQQMLNEGFMDNSDSRCAILEEMLTQKMLIEQAYEDSLEVTQPEIDKEIDKRIEALTDEIGSIEKLEKFYGKTSLEIKTEWRSLVKDQLLANKMKQKLLSDVHVSPNEIRKFYNKIPADSLPMVNPEYEYAIITINPPVTLEQKQALRAKLEEIRERIIKGEKFSKLAALYSDDLSSAKIGGDLGYVSRADLVTEFAAAAFKLKEGEVSRVVESEYGFHIIELIDRKGEKINCRHILLMPKVNSMNLSDAKRKIDSISTTLTTDTLTFREAATKYSDDELTKNNSGLAFNPYTGSSRFEGKHIEPTIFYNLKDLKPGEYSRPFINQNTGGRQVYSMVQLISKSDAHKASLTGDYQLIKDKATEEKRSEVFTEWIIEKQRVCYIKLDDSYRSCVFMHANWLK